MKISFKNDYSEGCHPKILQVLAETNEAQQNGYGLDEYCLEAADLLKKVFGCSHSDVYFVSGGTQANLLCASAFLKPYESVIAVATGHIQTNETGAVEATGHRINTVEGRDGKLYLPEIKKILLQHQNFPHQVKPRLVYISQATELGTVYSKEEIKTIKEFCNENHLLLYLDGARLSQALASETSDLTPEDIAQYTDAFYFGATKNGGLLGEAIVINKPELKEGFGYHMKQRGALLAKGRLLGLQFKTLLQDSLFLELAKHANSQAEKIRRAFERVGISFLAEPQTNQLFPILSESQIEFLHQNFEFYQWQKLDDGNTAIRLITSWATREEHTQKLIEKIAML